MQIPTGATNFADLHAASNQQKVAESCRQFEAGVWRSFLEKALSTSQASAPGKDVYQYFQADTLANRMAGQPGGFAAQLEAQLKRSASAPSL